MIGLSDMTGRSPVSILLAVRRPQQIDDLRADLASRGYDVGLVSDTEELGEELERHGADAVLVDADFLLSFCEAIGDMMHRGDGRKLVPLVLIGEELVPGLVVRIGAQTALTTSIVPSRSHAAKAA